MYMSLQSDNEFVIKASKKYDTIKAMLSLGRITATYFSLNLFETNLSNWNFKS